jgi:hypothetical protein
VPRAKASTQTDHLVHGKRVSARSTIFEHALEFVADDACQHSSTAPRILTQGTLLSSGLGRIVTWQDLSRIGTGSIIVSFVTLSSRRDNQLIAAKTDLPV